MVAAVEDPLAFVDTARVSAFGVKGPSVHPIIPTETLSQPNRAIRIAIHFAIVSIPMYQRRSSGSHKSNNFVMVTPKMVEPHGAS